MSKIFVLDANKQPLPPVHPGRARMLLTQRKAAVFRRYPFTIILKSVPLSPQVPPLRLKIDPGSKTTGIALVNDTTGEVVFAAELAHRAEAIKKALEQRRAVRRGRRQRKTRYRKPRFANRRRRKGWLAPSLQSRVSNVLTWVKRLMRLCPITAMSLELVKFDLQQMENPEIISNLCLACDACNKAKGSQDIQLFLAEKPDLLARLLAQAKAFLKDAAAVNTSRWALYERLLSLGLPIECGSGGLTKFNRTQRGLPKEHWIDAACVGKSTPLHLKMAAVLPLLISATGHGSRQKCNVNAIGFTCSKSKGAKKVKGYQTGDRVRAVVTTGTKQGIYVGRVFVRASGSFDIRTRTGRIQGISYRFCTPIQRSDGYSYQEGVPYAQENPCQSVS